MARRRRLSYQSNNGAPSPNGTAGDPPHGNAASSTYSHAPSPHGNAASSTCSHAPSPHGNAATLPIPRGPLILHLEDQLSQQGLTNIESQEQEEEQVHNVRGPTRGTKTEQLVKKKGKLVFGYTDTELRVHGEHVARFSNEIGSLVRHYAPVQYSGWSKVPKKDKEALFDKLERFNFNLGADKHLYDITENTFSERYKDFRHMYYKKYQEFVEKGVDPLEKIPFTYMKDVDWKWLCKNCFVIETFQVFNN